MKISDQPMQVLQGLGVSPGVAVGRTVSLQTRSIEVLRLPLSDVDIEPEVSRFHQASRLAQEEIGRLREKVRVQLGEELGAIFEAHSLFLDDPMFVERIVQRIRDEQVNAEWAVYRTAEEMAERFAAIENDYLKERHEDLRDVAHQLIRALQGIQHHELSEIAGEVVIVADELTPSFALRLGRQGAQGFAIESGGRTSHTSIIARSLNIPCVTGLAGLQHLVTDDDPLVVDGDEGKVILHPTAEVLADYAKRQNDRRLGAVRDLATRDLDSRTADGVPFQLMANLDLSEEIATALEVGAAGFGLYRSEFLYIERSPEVPSEEEHFELYSQIARAASPHPAIIRTFDLGGKKLARELLHTREENPVLGLRGIRLTLARPEMFRTQLRALFRASLAGDLWVMIPLVSTMEEVINFKIFAQSVSAELRAEGKAIRPTLKLGIMIEVPGAALIAHQLAREVDFFSIGTNDLIQYSLAVDRSNEHVAELYQPLHPGILSLLRSISQAAAAAGIPVSVCGEMAADPILSAVLVGLGLRRLSMSPRAIPTIKTFLRGQRASDLEGLVEECLRLSSASEVAKRVATVLSRDR